MGWPFVFPGLSSPDQRGLDSGRPSTIPFLITTLLLATHAKVYASLTKDLDWSEMTLFLFVSFFAYLHLYPLRSLSFCHLASLQPKLGRPALFSRKRQDELETGREAPAMASCLLFSSPLGFWCTSGYVQTALPDAFFELRSPR